jgi:hypothetical protein
MLFERKSAKDPEKTPSFVGKLYLGTVSEANYARFQAIVEAIPPPAKQFHGARQLNSTEPLRHCQHWTDEAI